MGPIGRVPDDVKILILKSLDLKDIRKAAEVNKLWNTLADKPAVWEQVAKNLDIRRDKEITAKEDVTNYFVNQVFKKYYPGTPPLLLNRKTREYQTELIEGFERKEIFFWKIHDQKIDYFTECALKAMLDPLTFPSAIISALGSPSQTQSYDLKQANLKMFQIIVDVIREAEATPYLLAAMVELAEWVPESMPFIQVLLQAGIYPNAKTIHNLECGINFQTGAGVAELKTLLDYTSVQDREKAVSMLQTTEKHEAPLMPSSTNVANKFSSIYKLIKEAPPPTYGGK